MFGQQIISYAFSDFILFHCSKFQALHLQWCTLQGAYGNHEQFSWRSCKENHTYENETKNDACEEELETL